MEIFLDHNSGIEQRLLIRASQVNGIWSRQIDQNGSTSQFPISSAPFPTSNHILNYIKTQNLHPVGFIVEHVDHNHTNQGDHNGTNLGDYNQTQPPLFLRPILKTLGNPIISANSVVLEGRILSPGNNQDLLLGIQVSESLFFTNPSDFVSEGFPSEDSTFDVRINSTQFQSKRLYFRAYARNSLFESFGNKKRLRLPETEPKENTSLFPNATKLEDNWKENWMGVFQENPNGWIYHIGLGWCFASPDNNGNVWLWINDHGWVWTNKITWPYLYRNNTTSWLYLLIRQSGPAVLFDELSGSFIRVNK